MHRTLHMRWAVLSIVLWIPVAATATEARYQEALQPMASAVESAKQHAALLAERAAAAPAAELTVVTDDEQAAFEAVIEADDALNGVTRRVPFALRRGSDDVLLRDFNDARDALSRYARARADGDRPSMRDAAATALDRLSHATALLEYEHSPSRIERR